MKQIITLGIFTMFLFSSLTTSAQRYLQEVFSDIQVETGIVYATNISVISGSPMEMDLEMDVYSPPASDTETERPLVMLFHTGNFLPIGLNGTTAGTRGDSTVVEIATRLAKYGYVVAVPDYRQGWNPQSGDLNVRRGTLINAAYRGVQDARSLVRFMRRDIEENDNSYGICDSRFAYWGIGTGGYVSLGAATLDEYADVVLPKFIDTDTQMPYVTLAANGDPDGLMETPLNMVNHEGYDSDVSLAINMGGALGDTSWLDAGDGPFISFQVPRDPFAPYTEGVLIVPTTGDPIVEVQGAYLVARKANLLGNNQVFADANIMDDFTTVANSRNDGFEGLFPMPRPCTESPFTPGVENCESSPWDWWDSAFWSTQPHPSCGMIAPPTCSFDVISRINNPDASPEKGRIYIDSIMGYVAPRAFAALNLEAMSCNVSTNELLNADAVNLSIAPNPAVNEMRFTSDEAMESIEIYNYAGQLMTSNRVEATSFRMNRDGLANGMYIAKIQYAGGIVSKKVVFN